MTFDVSSKETLAKLLATEDVTVIQKNTKTASFDLKNRTLTLPMWKDMDKDTTDHLTGHEVGHALYTPETDWLDAVKDTSKGYMSFVNVIEDARIEKLVLRRYPGLKRPFVRSYNKMLDSGFFGKSRTSINSYELIDRLNVHFKCGTTANVTFSDEEKAWVGEISNAEKFEDVVDIATRLYDKAKEEAKKRAEEAAEEAEEAEEDFLDDPGAETAGSDFEDFDEAEENDNIRSGKDRNGNESESKSESNETSPEGEEGEEDTESTNTGGDISGGDKWDGGPIAHTDKNLSKNIEDSYSPTSTAEIYTYKLDDIDPIKHTIPYKTVMKEWNSWDWSDGGYLPNNNLEKMKTVGGLLHKKFRANNKPTINYLVKEFEMKKRASEYARTTVSKTGVIDPIKMNNYRTSDDIFKKISVIPEGKNHGLLMFIDFSGSMCENLSATIDQTLNLVMFCRQVNIPFRVYGFTNNSYGGKVSHIVKRDYPTENTIVAGEDTILVELFSNKMNRMDFTRMIEMLLVVGLHYNERYNSHWRSFGLNDTVPRIPNYFSLGGTPLNDVIMLAINIHKRFKSENNLDIVNTVFLTDGESNPATSVLPERDNVDGISGKFNVIRGFYYHHGNKTIFIDKNTKKTYVVTNRHEVTVTLLEMFKDATKSNAIGFRILPKNKKSARNELWRYMPWEKFDAGWKECIANKFMTVPNSGYTEWFALRGGEDLETANTSIQVADDAKKGAIRNAFKKANVGRKSSRVMLSKFIELVA